MEEQAGTAPRKGGKWKWIMGSVLILLILAASVGFWWYQTNDFRFYIEMAGAPEVILEYGRPYHEPGAQMLFEGQMIFRDAVTPKGAAMKTISDVQTDKPGKYTVTYSADYNWWHAEQTRVVRIVDTQCPVITLVEDDLEGVQPGNVYEEAGFIAIDNCDGNITDRVVRIEEYGRITYAVVDSSGNPASVVREVPGFDPVSPQISLTEGTTVKISTGRVYEEPGYTAWDDADGDLTLQVEVEGEVVWYRSGSYPITYTVSDSSHNTTTVTRTVEVMAAPRIEGFQDQGKVIYLTFDDGPGPYTEQLLDVLDRYGVKATFFVTDSGYDDVMKQIVDRGHSIGIHTVSHDYEEIYASPEAFFSDLFRMQEIISQNTGVTTTLMRFPGGSSNTVSRNTQEGLMSILTEAVQDAGFQYFDWNVDSNDAGGAKRPKEVYYNVCNGVSKNEVSVVLQHDIQPFSVEAVEDIIVWGQDNGYLFLPLEMHSPTFHHPVRN